MEIRFLRAAYAFIQKCDAGLYTKLKKEIVTLKKDPYVNNPLKGKLRAIRSHRFYFRRTQYRIAYRIEKDMIVILIATRENFYKDLERKT